MFLPLDAIAKEVVGACLALPDVPSCTLIGRVAHDAQRLLRAQWSPDQPPRVVLCSADGTALRPNVRVSDLPRDVYVRVVFHDSVVVRGACRLVPHLPRRSALMVDTRG